MPNTNPLVQVTLSWDLPDDFQESVEMHVNFGSRLAKRMLHGARSVSFSAPAGLKMHAEVVMEWGSKFNEKAYGPAVPIDFTVNESGSTGDAPELEPTTIAAKTPPESVSIHCRWAAWGDVIGGTFVKTRVTWSSNSFGTFYREYGDFVYMDDVDFPKGSKVHQEVTYYYTILGVTFISNGLAEDFNAGNDGKVSNLRVSFLGICTLNPIAALLTGFSLSSDAAGTSPAPTYCLLHRVGNSWAGIVDGPDVTVVVGDYTWGSGPMHFYLTCNNGIYGGYAYTFFPEEANPQNVAYFGLFVIAGGGPLGQELPTWNPTWPGPDGGNPNNFQGYPWQGGTVRLV